MANKIYITQQGDWWDLIAIKVYGLKRGNDHYMHLLIQANYDLRNVSKFAGGVQINVPELPAVTEIPLVPWKIALQTT